MTARPRQWIKNALVVAAAGAAGALGRDDVPGRVALAAVAFCLLASGVYAINDVRDAAEDRLHPRKRFRPVAAGELGARAAIALGAGLMLAGLLLCAFVRPLLVVVGAGYLAVTLTYTAIWRHVLILDIVAIAVGFVLRAVAGGVAAPVALSRWFVLVITFAAVFVAAGKRRAELARLEADVARLEADGARIEADGARIAPDGARLDGSGHGRRRVLTRYTAPRLERILGASAAAALFAYCVWAFELPTVDGIPWRLLTIVPFAVCLLQYGALVRKGTGEAPEEVLLSDRKLQIAAVAWLILFALGVHAAG